LTDDYSKLANLVDKNKDSISNILGSNIRTKDWGLITLNNEAYYNPLEAEIFESKTSMFDKLKLIFVHPRDMETLRVSRSLMFDMLDIEDSIQSLVDNESFVRVYQEQYEAAVDIDSFTLPGLKSPIKKGDTVIMLNSSSGSLCGLYHKNKMSEFCSLTPYRVVITPFLYSEKRNPLLFYKKNVFTRFKRNKKNVITNIHSDWIKSRIVLGLTVKIRVAKHMIPDLFSMLYNNDLLKRQDAIIINGETLYDSFYEHMQDFGLADRYLMNSSFVDFSLEEGDISLATKATKADQKLFPDKTSFSNGLRMNLLLAEVLKTAILKEFNFSLQSILSIRTDKIKDHIPDIVEYSKISPYYNAGLRQSKTEEKFIDKLSIIAKSIIAIIQKEKSLHCATSRNFSIVSSNQTFIIGRDHSVLFSMGKRKHLEIINSSSISSPFKMDEESVIELTHKRRRGDRERLTSEHILEHFRTVSDDANAEKLLLLAKLIIASMIIDYKITVRVHRSPSESVNSNLVSMLEGQLINGVLSLVVDDRDMSTTVIESGRVLITNNECHSTESSIVFTDGPSDIQLRNQLSNAKTKKVLVKKRASNSDAAEFIYSISSKLSSLGSKAKAKQKILEIGLLDFAREYL